MVPNTSAENSSMEIAWVFRYGRMKMRVQPLWLLTSSKSASQDKLFLEPPKNLVRDQLGNKALPLQPLHPILTKKNWKLHSETQL